MNSNSAIPKDMVPSVLEKASRLYQQQNADYSLAELMAAGSEVSLPPELIQQAYQELQQEKEAAISNKLRQHRQLQVGGAIAATSILITGLWTAGVYNSLNAAKTTVEGKWAQVENQMQRRADLIPQITQVAQSYVTREESIMAELNAARDSFLNAATAEEQSAANEEMKSAIAQFQAFAANSQQLQSSELFINLQYEIAGTENRIATERMRYNQAVEAYNQSAQSFPTAAVAGLLGFEPYPL